MLIKTYFKNVAESTTLSQDVYPILGAFLNACDGDLVKDSDYDGYYENDLILLIGRIREVVDCYNLPENLRVIDSKELEKKARQCFFSLTDFIKDNFTNDVPMRFTVVLNVTVNIATVCKSNAWKYVSEFLKSVNSSIQGRLATLQTPSSPTNFIIDFIKYSDDEKIEGLREEAMTNPYRKLRLLVKAKENELIFSIDKVCKENKLSGFSITSNDKGGNWSWNTLCVWLLSNRDLFI